MRINDGDICYDNDGRVWSVYRSDEKHPDFIYMSTDGLPGTFDYRMRTSLVTIICLVCRNGEFINVTSGPIIQTKTRKIVSIIDFDLGI